LHITAINNAGGNEPPDCGSFDALLEKAIPAAHAPSADITSSAPAKR
jgi:hypothetical protein